MPSRTLPGLGLTGFWDQGFDGWDPENNINLRVISVLLGQRVLDLIALEPGSPADGEIYLLDDTHGTQANDIAIRDDGAWVYITPQVGWTFYDIAAGYHRIFNGTVWRQFILALLPDLAGNTGKHLAVNALEDGFLWSNPPTGGGLAPAGDIPGTPVEWIDFRSQESKIGGTDYSLLSDLFTGIDVADIDATGLDVSAGSNSLPAANATLLARLNDVDYTIVMAFEMAAVFVSGTKYYLGLDDRPTYSFGAEIYSSDVDGNGTVRFFASDYGGNVDTVSEVNLDLEQNLVIGARFDVGGWMTSINGQGVLDGSGVATTADNFLNGDIGHVGAGSQINGKIKFIALYPNTTTDDELADLTDIGTFSYVTALTSRNFIDYENFLGRVNDETPSRQLRADFHDSANGYFSEAQMQPAGSGYYQDDAGTYGGTPARLAGTMLAKAVDLTANTIVIQWDQTDALHATVTGVAIDFQDAQNGGLRVRLHIEPNGDCWFGAFGQPSQTPFGTINLAAENKVAISRVGDVWRGSLNGAAAVGNAVVVGQEALTYETCNVGGSFVASEKHLNGRVQTLEILETTSDDATLASLSVIV